MLLPLGHMLRTFRHARGLTQAELGQAIGRTQSEIFRWEKDIVRIPAQDLPALAKALGVSISQFFAEDKEPIPV